MMQVLYKRGYTLFYDSVLPPDMSNPWGYFESQKVKTYGKIPAHLFDLLEDKAVKVTNRWLLHFLRQGQSHQFSIFYMLRPWYDVIESHKKWRQNHNRELEEITPEVLTRVFATIVNQVLPMRNVKLRFVTFKEALHNVAS